MSEPLYPLHTMSESAIQKPMLASSVHCPGRSLVRDFGEVEQLQVSRKGPADFVSSADMRAEKILRNALAQAHPEFGLLMEEGGEIKGSDDRHRWIIDPLDGTTNFLHGLPHFCISVALERDGQVVAGIVYDPVKDELLALDTPIQVAAGVRKPLCDFWDKEAAKGPM